MKEIFERKSIMTLEDTKQLCDVIRQTAYEIHCYLKHGFTEKIYENALIHRLKKKGIIAEPQIPLKIYDEDETLLGEYQADLLVEGKLIIEIKACKTLTDGHVAQLLGYLKASRIEDGLLINFGASKVQIKKYIFS